MGNQLSEDIQALRNVQARIDMLNLNITNLGVVLERMRSRLIKFNVQLEREKNNRETLAERIGRDCHGQKTRTNS